MSSIHAVYPSSLVTPDAAWLADGCQRARKPDGGFLKRPLAAWLLPWLAFQRGQLDLEALRAYLGAHELRERRCQQDPDTPAHYTLAELQRLLQLPRLAPLERAAARLEETGLLTWTLTALHFVPHPERVEHLDPTGYAALRQTLPAGLTWVPVPRRLNVWLARDGQPGLIATALGVLTRCLRYQARQCVAGGRVAAGWIARVFGVAERTVHRSLQALEAWGWLARRPEGPQQERLHGRYTTLNLHWERPGMVVRTPREKDKETGEEARPVQRDAEPAGRPRKTSPPPRHNLSPFPALSCQNLSPLPSQHKAVHVEEERRYTNRQAPSSSLQPFQEINTQRPEPAERRPTGGWQCDTKAERQRGAQPLATTRPEPLEEATVTEAELTAATASLVAQGFKPAFLIRPTILAEVQRLRQAAAASPLTPPVPAPPPPLKQAQLPVAPCPGLPEQGAVTPGPASRLAARPTPPRAPVPRPSAPRPSQRPSGPRAPSLTDVTLADLRDVARLLDLSRHATARGWLRGSEAERLQVVAAAVHALRVGEEPCKLFVWLLRHQTWEVITQEDEDQARQRLRAHDWGPRPQPAPARAEPPAPTLSQEARFVQQAEQVVRQAGWRGEPFLALKLHDATWTRQRWDAAQAELAAWRQKQAARQRRGLLALGDVEGAARREPREGEAAE